MNDYVVNLLPDYGEYENNIDVIIQVNPEPIKILYSFGGNWEEYLGVPIRINRSKSLLVSVDFGGGVVIEKKGVYVIKNINGHIVTFDYNDVIYLIEEFLWKKR